MPKSQNPNANAECFAETVLGRKPTQEELRIGTDMNHGDCAGCWRAGLPDGSTIVYRPASKASSATALTTATVEIHRSNRLKSINANKDLKLKFPLGE